MFSFCFVLLLLFVGVACLYGLIRSSLVGRSAPLPGEALDNCLLHCGCIGSGPGNASDAVDNGMELGNVSESGLEPPAGDGHQCDEVSYIIIMNFVATLDILVSNLLGVKWFSWASVLSNTGWLGHIVILVVRS